MTASGNSPRSSTESKVTPSMNGFVSPSEVRHPPRNARAETVQLVVLELL